MSSSIIRIKRVHTTVAIMSKDHKFTFDKSQHVLAYFPELAAVMVDDTIIPMSNIREIQVEPPETPIGLDTPASSAPISAQSSPKDKPIWDTPANTPQTLPREESTSPILPSEILDGAVVESWFNAAGEHSIPISPKEHAVTTVTKKENKKNLRVKTAKRKDKQHDGFDEDK